jgi:peptide/nickel transport system substrate-binding protein
LYTVDNHLNYIPYLATNIPTRSNGGVTISGGNTVVTYKLKPNKWSDGTPETASDFVFGTKMCIDIGCGNSGLALITNLQAVNASTLRVTYKGLYAPYYSEGAPVSFPQHYLQKKYGTSDLKAIEAKFTTDSYNSPSDVFDGPFKIQSWTNGQSIVLAPNPGFSAFPAKSGHPLPAQIKFVNITSDEAGLATALQSSNSGVDKAEDFQATDLPVLEAGKYHITTQPALFVEHLELNQAGPLKDVRLRQALQYAIDKTALFKALFPQLNDPATYLLKSVLPNASPWANKSIPVSQYNPAKAKALLKAAGYSTDYNGPGKHLYLNFATTTTSVRQKDFQILSRYWANVGIHVSPHFLSGSPAANGGLFSPYNLNGALYQRHFDIALFAFSEPPDPQDSEVNFNPAFIPTASKHAASQENYTGVTDMDQYNLLVRARQAFDNSQRHALFNQWQSLVAQRVYWIMLYARTNITADDGRIGNYLPNPSSAGNSWNAYEWYVK